MIEINNKHIVLMLLIIIIGVFIYNYDVYVIPKNEPLCKPVYVTKREITPEIRAELNRTESEILKETFGNLAEIEYFESFGNLDNNENGETSQYDVPPKSFGSFVIPSLTSQHKIKVIDSVIKILSYIPTNYCETQIKQMVEYFAIIYETSPNLESFYKNIASSTKIKEPPYNSKYSHLILFLIGKFDNDYLSCPNPQSSDEQCAMNELLKEIINKKTNGKKSNNLDNSNNSDNSDNLDNSDNSDNLDNSNNIDNQTQDISPDYLSEQINMDVDSETTFNAKKVLNMIEKSKGKKNSNNTKTKSHPHNKSNVILPDTHSGSNLFADNSGISHKNTTFGEQNYLDELYPTNPQVPKFVNPIINTNSQSKSSKQMGTKKCNGAKCTYKCDSSYSNAISYLDRELKPIEGFGNIYDDYASFY
jgi:hypothetical protein